METRAVDARWWFCVALVLGCSSGGGSNASCPLQAETCWNSAVTEAQACVPTTMGVLGADNQTCTFDDGTVVLFDDPLTFPIPVASTNISVTVTKAGTQCARLVEDDGIANVTLTTQSGAHRIQTSLSGVTLTCGDGTKMVTKWSDCRVEGSYDTTGQPAATFSGGADDEISLFFQGFFSFDGGTSGLDSWFTCKKP